MKPTTHSELEKMLRNAGVVAILTKPPQEYIAVLSEKGNAKILSRKFRISCKWSNPDDIIKDLISEHLGIAIQHGEYGGSVLEYFIEDKLTVGVHAASMPGTSLRYIPEEPTKKTKHDPHWQYLPETVSITIYPAVPQQIEDDPDTLAANIELSKVALQSSLKNLEESIQKSQSKKLELEKLFEELSA